MAQWIIRILAHKKTKKLILVGYQAESKNYRLWDPETDKVTVMWSLMKILQANRSTSQVLSMSKYGFSKLVRKKRTDQTNNNVEEIVSVNEHDSDEEIECRIKPQQPIREQPVASKSLRNRTFIKPPKRYEKNTQYSIPETFQEVVTVPNKTKWAKAIDDELAARKANKIWISRLIPLIPLISALIFRWVSD